MRKQTRIAKFLMVERRGLLFPNMIAEAVDLEAEVLLFTKTPMMEQRVIAVVAKRVDAIMLFLIVCTAKVPFFSGSVIIEKTHCRRDSALREITVSLGRWIIA